MPARVEVLNSSIIMVCDDPPGLKKISGNEKFGTMLTCVSKGRECQTETESDMGDMSEGRMRGSRSSIQFLTV